MLMCVDQAVPSIVDVGVAFILTYIMVLHTSQSFYVYESNVYNPLHRSSSVGNLKVLFFQVSGMPSTPT